MGWMLSCGTDGAAAFINITLRCPDGTKKSRHWRQASGAWEVGLQSKIKPAWETATWTICQGKCQVLNGREETAFMQKLKKSTSRKLHRSLQRNTAAKNSTAALMCVCVRVCVCLKALHWMKPCELCPAWHRCYSNNNIPINSGQTVEENRGEMENTQRSPCILWELKLKEKDA